MKAKILISACLMGLKVRYNGSEKSPVVGTVKRWQQEQRLVVHCPELAAGLSTPRLPAELCGGDGLAALDGSAKILESDGSDLTQRYILAAWLALRAARHGGCRFALLTDGSPTCGSQNIYDGQFRGTSVSGQGVASALLRQHGIEVFSHGQIEALDHRIRQFEKETI